MADLNMTYSTQSAPAVAGMIADSERMTDNISKIAKTALASGVFVKYTSAATNDYEISQVDDAADVSLGVTRWTPVLITPDAVSLAAYSIGDQVSVITAGRVYVQASKAVVAGTKAYAIISGGTKGKVTDTAADTTTTEPVGVFRETIAGAGLVVVELIKTL